jgi:hypothetical protein
LSVISPASSKGGSLSKMARQTRFELPVLPLAKVVSRARNSSSTHASAVTSAAPSAASRRQASRCGKISAPISLQSAPAMTTSRA